MLYVRTYIRARRADQDWSIAELNTRVYYVRSMPHSREIYNMLHVYMKAYSQSVEDVSVYHVQIYSALSNFSKNGIK